MANGVKDTCGLLAVSGLLCLFSYPYLCDGNKINFLVLLHGREQALVLLTLLLPCMKLHVKPYYGRGWGPNFRISHGGEPPDGPKGTPGEI